MDPKVSIIVPCWGVEKYLDRCLESLICQTLKNIEIILVDDESPDKVPQMCDEWSRRDERIVVIHKKNEGLGLARNSGMDIAKGEYISFVDSDDYVSNDMFEELYNAAKFYDADIVTSGINKEMQSGVWKKERSFNSIQCLGKHQAWEYAKGMVASMPNVRQEKTGEISVCTSIFKSRTIKENRITFRSERDIASEDLLFKVQFYKFVNTMIYIPQCYYHYCLNGGSLTTTFNTEKFLKFCELRTILIDLLGNNKEGRLRADRFFLGCCRTYTTKLICVRDIDQSAILKGMLSNEVWNQIRLEYRPSYLPFAQSLLYRLQILGNEHLVILYAKLYLFIKTKLGKKNFIQGC